MGIPSLVWVSPFSTSKPDTKTLQHEACPIWVLPLGSGSLLLALQNLAQRHCNMRHAQYGYPLLGLGLSWASTVKSSLNKMLKDPSMISFQTEFCYYKRVNNVENVCGRTVKSTSLQAEFQQEGPYY